MLAIAPNQHTNTTQIEERIFVALKVHEFSKPEFSRLRLRSEPSVAQRLLSAGLELMARPIIAENHHGWWFSLVALPPWFLARRGRRGGFYTVYRALDPGFLKHLAIAFVVVAFSHNC
jgi:hypothetical protein